MMLDKLVVSPAQEKRSHGMEFIADTITRDT